MSETNNESVDVKKSSFGKSLLFSFAFFFVGVLLAIISVNQILTHIEKGNNYTETIGKVISHNMNNNLLRAIVAEYEVDGEKYEITSKRYTNNPEAVGSVISIKYNPNNPSDAIFTYESISLILPIISGVLLLIGLIMIIKSIKKKFRKKVVTNEIKIEDEMAQETQYHISEEKKKNVSPDQQTLGKLRMSNNDDSSNV